MIEIGDEISNEEEGKGGKRKLESEAKEGEVKKLKTTDEKLYCLCKTLYDPSRQVVFSSFQWIQS